MSKNVVLESERLYYRPVDSNYLTDIYLQWLNDPDVIRFMEIFEPYSREQLKQFLADVTANENLLFWAIHLKSDGKHIGNIKIDPVNRRHRWGEYGIMIGDKSEWGKGFGSEASRTIVDYCFKTEGLRKITLGVIDHNTGAVSLYKKTGFVVEGVYRKHVLYNERYLDVIRMAIFNPAFDDK